MTKSELGMFPLRNMSLEQRRELRYLANKLGRSLDDLGQIVDCIEEAAVKEMVYFPTGHVISYRKGIGPRLAWRLTPKCRNEILSLLEDSEMWPDGEK